MERLRQRANSKSPLQWTERSFSVYETTLLLTRDVGMVNFNPKSCLVCSTVGEPEQFAHPQNPKSKIPKTAIKKR
jgi:hypothetical protein